MVYCVKCGMSEDCKCEEVTRFKKALSVYEIQFKAAMKAQSLGLCKKVISHALEDVKKILENGNEQSTNATVKSS